MAEETGNVILGFKEVFRIMRTGKPKLILVASNPSNEIKNLSDEAKINGINIYHLKHNSIDLGTACGRRYPVSIVAIMKPGESEILDLIKGE